MTSAEYWRAHLHLAGGLLAGLIVLPLYAATLIRKLSAARQQAEEASRAKSRFLTSVSHELRTPLNAIIGLSELMRSTPLDSEQQDMTRTIGTAGRSLLALINQILDLGRIEERRIQTAKVEFDLHAVLADVRSILSVQAHAKSVRFAVHVTTRTPRFVKTDRRHLQEILVNLGGNAVKFTERGFVVIAVDAEERDGADPAALRGVGQRHRHRAGSASPASSRASPRPTTRSSTASAAPAWGSRSSSNWSSSTAARSASTARPASAARSGSSGGLNGSRIPCRRRGRASVRSRSCRADAVVARARSGRRRRRA